MIELQGKYNMAKVFTDSIEQTAISQIINLLNQPFVDGASIRIMSDVHAGAGCVIGFTADLQDMVIPNLVGVDIGCGMLVVDITNLNIDIPELDNYIHSNIPAGFSIHSSTVSNIINKNKEFEKMLCFDELYKNERFGLAIGTLGSGNHFIEVDHSDKTGKTYLIIHTGSRNMGKQVADYYQKIAIENQTAPQKDLCYLTDSDMENYLHDMKICQEYAITNRATIAYLVLAHFNAHMKTQDNFTTVHNYINFDDGIMRKGAVSANANERLIIPMNMRDGSLICVGKGNADWNFSAPHGAGRIMSRGEAKRSINLDDYKESMEGIYTTCVNQGTLDESPMAYKPMEEIISNIGDTVEIVDIVKPVYNFKAGGE
jgi:tRNA-splicing ligase RtcB (3'-phosphate/5'-hydroxy nucleic acid ligase)